MGPFTALLFATPVFGLALQAPMVAPLPLAAPAHVAPAIGLGLDSLHFEVDVPPPVDVQPTDPDPATPGAASALAQTAAAPARAAHDASPSVEEQAELEYENATRERNRIASLHRIFGISTWVSMTATLILGGIQYHNMYGEFSRLEDTPCVRGTAIFGQGACTGTPWPHAIAAGITTGLYFSTLTLSLFMPDPDNAAEGNSAFARTLRTHKILRWVHLGGMIAQIILGPIIAMAGNRASDYGTLQTLATVHMGLGLVTYGALTWAGALMSF
ncbi:MAG: hypothetical protein IPK60_19865 [Sandaracinaceae bacterium]|nr:hypothetical protein [Sandaracinaceae bacterium]